MNAPAKFGRLTLIERDAGRTNDKHVLSRWLCDCGTEMTAPYSRAKSGAVRSCGCLTRERSSESATKHGGRNTREYSSWIAMRRRCLSPADKDYPTYGGRGITICQEWLDSFEAFREHLGPRPDRTTLDRIDGTKGYEPGNVRWAAADVQGRNRRGTHIWHIKGETFGSITEAAAAFGVSEQTVFRWVNGAFDRRRNKPVAPRADCSAEERYSG